MKPYDVEKNFSHSSPFQQRIEIDLISRRQDCLLRSNPSVYRDHSNLIHIFRKDFSGEFPQGHPPRQIHLKRFSQVKIPRGFIWRDKRFDHHRNGISAHHILSMKKPEAKQPIQYPVQPAWPLWEFPVHPSRASGNTVSASPIVQWDQQRSPLNFPLSEAWPSVAAKYHPPG